EPQARYASALSLAEDLERHLKGIPVLARPSSARYRINKFVRRNRVSVVAAAAVLTLFAAASSVTWYQSRRIAAESRRVARERDKALEVRSFLLEMFGATGPDQPAADALTARQLLDRRAASLAATHGDDSEMRAEMMYVLAEGYEKLGLPAEAEPLAREALRLRRHVFGEQHPDVSASLNLLGWIMRQREDLVEAERLLREAIAVGRTAFPAEGDPRLARALNDLGVVRDARADYAEAKALYEESLAMRKRFLGERHLGVAITTSNLAVVLFRLDDLSGAVTTARSALGLLRDLLGDDHQRTSNVKTNLATMLSRQRDHEAAAALHREILESRKRVVGARHPLVANSMTMLANELRAFKNYAAAESLLASALEILSRAYGTRHSSIASTLRVLGDVKYDAGRPADALRDYDAARDVAQTLGVNARGELGIVLRRASRAHEALGDYRRAEVELREFVRIARLAPARAVGTEANVFLLEFLVRRGKTSAAAELLEAMDGAADSSLSQALRERITAARRQLRASPGPRLAGRG
ncbi:MAG: tetratricopeptide repeat protein, partial [Gemmatimonadaceae bacterium]